MNIHSEVYQPAEEQHLSPLQSRTLLRNFLSRVMPSQPSYSLWRLASVLSAALCGFGLIMWIAANWDLMDRSTHFVLLQVLTAFSILAALIFPRVRIPLSLLAMTGIGALFAYYGQTYQTGADPWQLFAVWATLSLPLCLGARSSVLWIPWTMITLTALSLWLYMHTGYSLLGINRDDFPIHTAWFFYCTLLMCLLAPQLNRWTGAGFWSQRAALLLICCLVLSLVFSATSTTRILPQYYLALIWLVLAFALFIWRPLYDVVNASILLLSLDAALLFFLYHFFQYIQPDLAHDYLLLIGGIFSTLLFAASSLLIIKIDRFYKAQNTLSSSAQQSPPLAEEEQSSSMNPPHAKEHSWALILFTGIGSWVATLLLGIGIYSVCTLFFNFIEISNFFLVIGLICIVLSSIALCQKELPLLLSQACLPILFVGLMLFASALLLRTSSLSSTMLIILCFCLIIAFFIHSHWHRALLGFSAACSGSALIVDQLNAFGFIAGSTLWLLYLSYGLLLIWIVLLFAQDRLFNYPWGRYPALYLESCNSGWLILAFIALCAYSGSTFLLKGILNLPAQAEFTQMGNWQQFFIRGLPAVGTTFAACAWLAFRWPDLRQKKNLTIAVIFCALAFFMPALGPTLLALSISLASGRRLLALAASISAIWIIGAFYYQLQWPLIHKAQLLAGTGLVLALLSFFFRNATSSTQASVKIYELRPNWRIAAPLCLCLIATLALAIISIREKEDIIANGRPIFVSLRPIDPRSLMQGDYMALNFPLPLFSMDNARPGEAPTVRLTVDERGIATIRRDHPEVPLQPDQYKIQLNHTSSGWAFVTNAWHFKEGEGERWAQAEFGEFRLLPDGRALLVGMRDRDLKPIQ